MENKILLVDADFYKDIADELVRGAVGQLEERNLKYSKNWEINNFLKTYLQLPSSEMN